MLTKGRGKKDFIHGYKEHKRSSHWTLRLIFTGRADIQEIRRMLMLVQKGSRERLSCRSVSLF